MAVSVLTLLTDFGLEDPYVGVMKGQILKLCPRVRLVDLTHAVPPQQVSIAAFHLEQSVDYFPDGTVHLVVVDPGVGTDRAMLALRTQTAAFVAPDNGVLTRALRLLGPPLEVVRLPLPQGSSATFHGRDVMAPAAARLACGASLSDLGERWEAPLTEWDFPSAVVAPDRLQASVLAIDTFGNVCLDLSQQSAPATLALGSVWQLQGQPLLMGRTYAQVAPGASLLLWSSHGLLELACREARADQAWSLRVGDRVELTR